MAWMDDRVWCHPKFVGLSDRAFRVYWNSVCYSSGLTTRGQLSPSQQKIVGSSPKTREELLKVSLWEQCETGVIIHDWDDHNQKRDARKQGDRERKRRQRANEKSAGQNADSPQDVHTLKVKEVKVTKPLYPLRDEPRRTDPSVRCPDCGETNGAGHLETCPRMPPTLEPWTQPDPVHSHPEVAA
jgi:hypothetical protein